MKEILCLDGKLRKQNNLIEERNMQLKISKSEYQLLTTQLRNLQQEVDYEQNKIEADTNNHLRFDFFIEFFSSFT